MLKKFKADLHIHTCLSPCSDLQITPSAIVKTATERGINIIAITDHNSAENVIAAKKAAEKTSLKVLPGIEVSTSEEVHILAIFEDIPNALNLQNVIYDNMMPDENDPDKFGDQVIVNEEDEVLGFNKRLLISSTTLNAFSVINTIHSFGGISIASHIDRGAFSVISQLGFISDDLKFDALEISPGTDKKTAEDLFKDYRGSPWVSSSDAHCLEDIGKRTTNFLLKEASFKEIVSAFKNIDGRMVEWE